MSERVLHMIGNAHIDPVWLWRVAEATRARDVPVGDRPDGGVPRVRVHLRLGRLPPVDRGNDPELFAKIRERWPRSVPGNRRLVGRAGLQHPVRRVVRPAGAVRAALAARPFQGSRRRREATSTRSATTRCCRSSSTKSRLDSYVFLRPGPNSSSCPVSTSGGSRRTARECSRTGSRSTAARAATSTSTSRRRSRRCHRKDRR